MDFLQLAGKSILIFGVANRKSVAWHVGRVLAEAGAKCVYVVQNDDVRRNVANCRQPVEKGDWLRTHWQRRERTTL